MAKKSEYRKTLVRNRRKRRKILSKSSVPKGPALSAWKPGFIFNDAGADPEFVNLVKTIMDAFDYKCTKTFPMEYRFKLEVLKNNGMMAVCRRIAEATDGSGNMTCDINDFNMHIGELIINAMSDDEKDRFLPMNDVMVSAAGINDRKFTVKFSSMKKLRHNNQPVLYRGEQGYYSSRMPTVEVNGVGKIVAFSKHCIDRICERLMPDDYKTYGGLGNIHAFLADCIYFEPVEIKGESSGMRQPAISFYQDCFLHLMEPGVVHPQNYYFLNLVDEIHPAMFNTKWYYRVGYCPIEVVGEFAFAKTLLLPGYTKTPEYDLLEKSNLNAAQKADYRERARNHVFDFDRGGWDYELVRLFHRGGIPQIISFDRKIFERPLRDHDELMPIDNPFIRKLSNWIADLKNERWIETTRKELKLASLLQ